MYSEWDMFRHYEEERKRREMESEMWRRNASDIMKKTDLYVKEMMMRLIPIDAEMIATFRSSIKNGKTYNEAKIAAANSLKVGHETTTQDRPENVLLDMFNRGEISSDALMGYGHYIGLEFTPSSIYENVFTFNGYVRPREWVVSPHRTMRNDE